MRWRCPTFQCESSRLIRCERCLQDPFHNIGRAYGQFLSVHFARCFERAGELDLNLWRSFSVEFNKSDDHFIAHLRFLESQHADVRLIHAHERETATQFARMLFRNKGDQWSAETISLPVRLALT